ncbi:hypothetical protein [Flavobacterium sp. J27]|uniref:hypothetical protein n=1 Tax=Flavobacterium sp. J27 TaxID=2060419 RepID=UPI0013EEC46D|nr:hypothetical protein [Flavobacterium sp. J27]
MNNKLKKLSKRLYTILTNSLKQTINQIFGLSLSLYIIHFYSKDLWGNFVTYFLYSSIILLILNWGNKEYLLRDFSKAPNKIIYNFYLNFNTRFILLIPFTIITFLFFSITEASILFLWFISGFISQSLEVFWIYKKDFLKAILIEIISFIILTATLFLHPDLNSIQLLFFYSFYQFIRALLYIRINFIELKKNHFTTNKIILFSSLSFFLLNLIGFLQSRTDFLIVTFFEKNENIAIYQIITSYFILIHSIATFMILPFIKNLYRIKIKSMELIQRYISIISPFIVIANLFIFHLIITYIYKFKLDFYFYLLGFFITLPPYLYAVKIIRFYKENNQKYILNTGIKAMIINCIISFSLLYYGYGIKGALLGSAISQIFTTYQYLKFKF